MDDDTAVAGEGAGSTPGRIQPGTPVQVASLYDGRWHPGFVVHRTEPDGYWLERGDGTLLPAPVPPTRVVPARIDG